ncbi:hypothetical protein AVEN_68826-1 [Araneus ventricosus]|uniref:Uncharacterized protein n=1 Tax=Araneus ventricosus TaxID=182803 RepID=A0A4Y2C5W6_ARAVE|nr:hypothetical protein AVEN_68826-1 [Araneus ventricosus]
MPPLGLEMGRKFSTNEALCSLGQRRSTSYPEPTTWTWLHLGLFHHPYPTNQPHNHICVIIRFKVQLWYGIISNGMMKIPNLVLSRANNLIQRILVDRTPPRVPVPDAMTSTVPFDKLYILADSKSKISHNGEKNILWESEFCICLNRRMDYGLIFPY